MKKTDLISSLPADDMEISTSDKLLIDKIFAPKQEEIQPTDSVFLSVSATIVFFIISTPQIQSLLLKTFPIFKNDLIYLITKTIIFFLIILFFFKKKS
jgi:hypothetical protein